MIDVRGTANFMIQPVNEDVVATLKRNVGYDTAATGRRTPRYETEPITLQIQALSKGEIKHLDGLNIQGVRRAAYFDGAVFGLVRVAQRGGDVLVFPTGTLPEGDEWLCVHVLEQWPTWGKVALSLQNPETA